MAKHESSLPFDPAAVRKAIEAHRTKADSLEGLLRAHGLLNTPTSQTVVTVGTVKPLKTIKKKVRRRSRTSRAAAMTKQPAKQASLLPTERPKMADDAWDILSVNNWRAHGKVIMTDLLKRGHMKDSKFPASTMSTAMVRDKRFKRDPDVKNTWIVKEEYRNVR